MRQGPWIVDLRTPPGQECSNGSLLCICRGRPGTPLFSGFLFVSDGVFGTSRSLKTAPLILFHLDG